MKFKVYNNLIQEIEKKYSGKYEFQITFDNEIFFKKENIIIKRYINFSFKKFF